MIPNLKLSIACVGGLVLSIAVAAAARPAPEKADLSPEDLMKTATHVVVGEVRQIWTRVEEDGSWDVTHGIAEIAVDSLEKGEGIAAGALVYARYWTREWDGWSPMPPSTTGHRGLPKPGARTRVYLASNAYDGFGESKDGGFNVIGANGFAKP